ncbi:mechanosensitive ion channel [Cocleimonas sp. KMM 6892]|uniref:mechanosensitive ion channel family protein n=1 Tax=unclassified Cocleimonas TaxID=2639732 RepID=UPI002DB64209|nr:MULTISPECIES: mechanosensitive ion channel domain-containing protein [unclassified Cocleimonas]MEB8432191.1 mechanosensitive ion channel [Cocleimonas sp. KMM 6892]MEC4714723.1 mechanosensitive ion channel [Cocleimonas sp. KMM 6895]MEC4744463.1 mechanosensitive ion channel [Cocleimonas sp. KMM 6896]
MDSAVDKIIEYINQVDSFGYLLIGANLFLLIFAKVILKAVYHQPEKVSNFSRKVMIFRALNLLIILAYGYFRFFQDNQNKTLLIHVIAVLAVIYFAYLSMHITHGFLVRYYGKEREVNGVKRFVSTYQTRLLSIFSNLFIAVIALISIIRLLGFDSVLEAGGVIGIIGVFLALTSSIWAPDIFHGLIILNSDMLTEGDVIQFNDGELVYGLVYKTKVFHTVILNIPNNHRIMIRNSKLRDFTVHNLSKFASARGLRESLSFKISYDTSIDAVEDLFLTVYDAAKIDNGIYLEPQYDLEFGVKETGDHAVEWVFYYFTKEVDKLLLTRQRLLQLMLKTSIEKNISLSTPVTINNLTPAIDIRELDLVENKDQ